MTSDQWIGLFCALFVAGATNMYSGPMLMLLAIMVLVIACTTKRSGR